MSSKIRPDFTTLSLFVILAVITIVFVGVARLVLNIPSLGGMAPEAIESNR